MSDILHKTIVVIGGGAAGMYCAINAARLYPSVKVILLEKSNQLLAKVKVSGGGRCNLTHDCSEISHMVKFYPRGSAFLKKAFHNHFTTDTIQWFQERGVATKTEADGRMFPSTNDSQTIIDCLLMEAARYKVEIKTKSPVYNISRAEDGWMLHLANDKKIFANKICIAAGGHNSADKFQWLHSLQHTIVEPVPSLFTFNLPKHPINALMGVVVKETEVKIAGEKLVTTGPVLITHWGLSGPAILKQSAWAAIMLAEKKYNFQVVINWVPAYKEDTILNFLKEYAQTKASSKICNKNPFDLPSRFWEYLLSVAEINSETRYADLPAKNRNKLCKLLCNHNFEVTGKTTFKEEFVTAGGIDTAEINPMTMESRINPGIYFAGEILNVDGVTGGYNFQNAWTTGFTAAKNMG